MHSETLLRYNKPAADFNGNGTTDISDATELINHLLNTQG